MVMSMKIKDSGERTEYDTGAVRDMSSGKGRFDLCPWRGIWEVAKHCEEGAEKYGEHNVDKGIPIHSFIDSAFRHLAKYTMGMDDEPHLRAAAWNILWAMQTEIEHPELQDIPVWMEKCKQKEKKIFEESLEMIAQSMDENAVHNNDSKKRINVGDKIRKMDNKEIAFLLCSQGWLLGDEKECEDWLNSVEDLYEKD